MSDSYFDALLAALPEQIRKALQDAPEDREDFQAAIDRLRKTHAAVDLSASAFGEHLVRHDENDSGWGHWSRLRLGDLYVALGCGRGQEAALTWIESQVFSQLGSGLGGMGLSASEVDEVRQHVRQKLLVSDGDDEPRILTYAGRASLFQWARVIARRVAVDRFRKAAPESSLEEMRPIAQGSGEKDIVSALTRPDFRDALLEASASLPKKDREILHLSFAQGASIDEIGEKFGVHRSTAARWIEKAKEALLEATRSQLETKLKLNPFEIDELIELVGNQIDVTITTLLMLKTGTKNLDP